jgi:hypothetical protein
MPTLTREGLLALPFIIHHHQDVVQVVGRGLGIYNRGESTRVNNDGVPTHIPSPLAFPAFAAADSPHTWIERPNSAKRTPIISIMVHPIEIVLSQGLGNI